MTTTVTDGNFQEIVLDAQIPVLVDFWAEWCAPCKTVAPILETLAGECDGKLVIAKLNIDENPHTAQKYGIMSIPALLVFKNGKIVNKKTGAGTEAEFRSFIEQSLV